jgi:hypothetical protein
MDLNQQPPIQQNQMPQQPISQIPSSRSKWKLILFIIILLIFVGGGAYYLGIKQNKVVDKNQQKIDIDISPTSEVQKITIPSITLTPKPSLDINGKIFTSTALGISFNYLPIQDNTKITVKEMKDKVCITYDSNDADCSKGQWVQTFNKNANDSLSEAIKKQFLSSYSPNDCFVSTDSLDNNKNSYPETYETAVISFPKTDDADGPWWKNAEKCPAHYTTTNGIAFFLEDKTHPDKLLFFNIGQYAITSAESGKSWYQTVSIND